MEEDEKTEDRVMHDRAHLLDAAIVRVMKARKTSTWSELTNLVVDAVCVSPPSRSIAAPWAPGLTESVASGATRSRQSRR